MTYSKQTWNDNDVNYPASAARFTHLEDGVEAAETAGVSAAVVNEAANPLDPQWAGGAPTDGTTDAYAALNACLLAVAGASKGRIVIPPYTFKVSQGLVYTGRSLRMDGAGARRSRFQLIGSGTDDVFRFRASDSVGFSSQGRISGISFCSESATARAAGCGLVLDQVQHVEVNNCYAFGNFAAYDMRNNCYGSRFVGCSNDQALNKVGLVLRGDSPLTPGVTAGSGSDISLFDNWFGGTDAAIWMEPNAGGYHIYGGQLAGGSTAASALDANGSVLLGCGLDVLTTTVGVTNIGATTITVANASSNALFTSASLVIGANQVVAYTGRVGDATGGTITGVTGVTASIPDGTPIYLRGRTSQVELHGVSFEGTTKRHAVRAYGTMDGLSLNECSINSNGSNRIISVIKGTDCANSVIMLRRSAVRGFFSGVIPLDLQNLSASWDVHEEAPNVVDAATFNGVGMVFQTQPMIERSAIGTRSRAFFGDKMRFGGRTLRWNSGVLESNTDSSAASGWSVLGSGGGAAADQLLPYTRPGVLVVESGVSRLRFPAAVTIVSVAATVNTAPVGASILVDVNKNGTTIFSTQANRPTIAAAGTSSADKIPDVTAVAAGDYLTVDIDQIGSSTAGADLSVIIRYH